LKHLAVGLAVLLLCAPLAGHAATSAEAPCGTVIVPTALGMGPLPAPAATMDPALMTGSIYESEAINLLYRPLVWVNGEQQIDWTESMASAITPSADRTRFTVTLRPWHWSDGTTVTAADVLYDWQLIKSLGAAYYDYKTGGVPDLIRDITAPDDRTLVFDLTRPVNPYWFELAGLGQFFPLPRQAWGRYSVAQQQSLQSKASFYSVVDGPFRLASLTLGRNAVFVPNSRYDGHKPRIARFVMDFLQGTDPLEALEAGDLDMASIPFDLMPAMRRLHGVRTVTIGHAPVLATLIPNLAGASARPFLRDVRVRQAIARAIDQQRIVDSVYHGNAMLQYGFVPSSMSAFLAPALAHGASPLSHDPAAARRLLEAAGYHPGPDGIRVGHGQRLAFTVLVSAGAEERIMTLQLMQADLARVGIAVDIKEVEFNQLIARMLGPPAGWDAVFMEWTITSYPDPTQWFATGSSGNYTHYSDKRMDALLDNATGSADRAALDRLQMYVLEQQPMIFLPAGSYTELVRPGIGGVQRFLSANGNWTPEYLTLGGPLACGAPVG